MLPIPDKCDTYIQPQKQHTGWRGYLFNLTACAGLSHGNYEYDNYVDPVGFARGHGIGASVKYLQHIDAIFGGFAVGHDPVSHGVLMVKPTGGTCPV
jgi:hypothetical protein